MEGAAAGSRLAQATHITALLRDAARGSWPSLAFLRCNVPQRVPNPWIRPAFKV